MSSATGSLTYQEVLRTLGTLIEDCGCAHAAIVLTREGAEIHATEWRWQRHWTHETLREASARQRRWRGRRRSAPDQPEGIGRCLRLVGSVLDRRGADRYVITVRLDSVRVHGADGYHNVFEVSALQRRALLARHLRGQLDRASRRKAADETRGR